MKRTAAAVTLKLYSMLQEAVDREWSTARAMPPNATGESGYAYLTK